MSQQVISGQLVQGQVLQGQLVQGQLVAGGQVTSTGQMVVTNASNLTPLTQQQIVTQMVPGGQALTNNTIVTTSPVQPNSSSPIKCAPSTQTVPPPLNSQPMGLSDNFPPLLTKQRMEELVREVDPSEQLDEDVEELLMSIADDFIETTVNSACRLARHRNSRTLDVRDLQMYLERNWNMWVPGFGTEEIKPYKRAPTTEAHKQRLAILKKAIKKY